MDIASNEVGLASKMHPAIISPQDTPVLPTEAGQNSAADVPQSISDTTCHTKVAETPVVGILKAGFSRQKNLDDHAKRAKVISPAAAKGLDVVVGVYAIIYLYMYLCACVSTNLYVSVMLEGPCRPSLVPYQREETSTEGQLLQGWSDENWYVLYPCIYSCIYLHKLASDFALCSYQIFCWSTRRMRRGGRV